MHQQETMVTLFIHNEVCRPYFMSIQKPSRKIIHHFLFAIILFYISAYSTHSCSTNAINVDSNWHKLIDKNEHSTGQKLQHTNQIIDDCDIKIINQSHYDVIISGGIDNMTLQPFVIYSYELPHYISLYYYGYCYQGMFIHIDTARGMPVYDRYTPVGTTLYIRSYNNNLIKVDRS